MAGRNFVGAFMRPPINHLCTDQSAGMPESHNCQTEFREWADFHGPASLPLSLAVGLAPTPAKRKTRTGLGARRHVQFQTFGQATRFVNAVAGRFPHSTAKAMIVRCATGAA